MNISSIVVKTTQSAFDSVKEAILEVQGCEIYLEDKASSQIIVVLEAKSTQKEVEINKYLESLPGVINANMHYTYQEDELNAQLVSQQDGIIEFLNDDSIPAENIAYSGSIAHLMGKSKKKN